MATELRMPQLGLTMESGTIEKWLKSKGDTVSAGEAVVEINTDKLTSVVESPVDGVILDIVANEGDELPVQAVIAHIGAPGEAVSADSGSSAEKAKAPESGKLSVAVVGGGPGGYVAAIRASQLGAEVTLIEKQHLGGTCLNCGCIPTKCLIQSAELIYELKNRAAQLGVICPSVKVDMPQVIANRQSVSDRLTGGVSALLKMNGVKRLEGTARFSGEKQLEVRLTDGSVKQLSPDRIILAVGSSAAVPGIPEIDGKSCISSTQALSMTDVPESLLILGGGVVGVELGYAYAAFGSKVTIIELADAILPQMDSELTRLGIAKMEELGIDIRLSTSVERIESDDRQVRAYCRSADGAEVVYEAQKLLLAAGRSANTSGLNFTPSGISESSGRIITNASLETVVPGVYAVGDCADGYAQLAGTASVMGEIAAENALGGHLEYDEKTNPSCVHLGMDFACVGMTEDQVKASGIEYNVGKFPLSANGKSIVLNGGEGMIKVITGKEYNEILGVHIIGPNASDLIAEGALAIGMEATAEDVCAVIYAHPTVAEAVKEAVLHSQGRAIHTKNAAAKKR